MSKYQRLAQILNEYGEYPSKISKALGYQIEWEHWRVLLCQIEIEKLGVVFTTEGAHGTN